MDKAFKAFSKIERIGKAGMAITQKIHGTNAQIFIYEENGTLELLTGSRTRWIYPGDDNYGFAQFVHSNKAEFIEKLGQGVHFGEWAGPGINSGEGLSEKTFVLFDFWRYPEDRPLPPQTRVVPVLYQGTLDASKIDEVMADLKTNGSKLAPGFMRPEGCVVTIGGVRYKKVFEAEEVKWCGVPGDKKKREDAAAQIDYSYLLQPMRLEKLLSRDEKYVRDFPQSLSTVVKDYFDDLIQEGQIAGTDGEIRAVRKGASSDVFGFIRKCMERT